MHKELVNLEGFAQAKEYWNMLRAIQVASDLHTGQCRKGGGEYIDHPMKVTAELVALRVYDQATLTAALLHDVLEDCETTESELIMKYRFSEDTIGIVKLLTKDGTTPTEVYYKNLRQDIRAILIKISDRCHNISTMVNAFTIEKIKDYMEETVNHLIPLCKYARRYYPEYGNIIKVMRNHIESVMDCIRGFIAMMENNGCIAKMEQAATV